MWYDSRLWSRCIMGLYIVSLWEGSSITQTSLQLINLPFQPILQKIHIMAPIACQTTFNFPITPSHYGWMQNFLIDINCCLCSYPICSLQSFLKYASEHILPLIRILLYLLTSTGLKILKDPSIHYPLTLVLFPLVHLPTHTPPRVPLKDLIYFKGWRCT